MHVIEKTSLRLLVVLLGLATSALQAMPGGLTPDFVDHLVGPYLKTQQGLAGDDLAAAQTGAQDLLAKLESAPEGPMGGHVKKLRESASAIVAATDIEAARTAFLPLSNALTMLVKHVGTSGEQELFVAHCPMAFGYSGGDWIQADEQVLNPYFGASMLHCGGIQEQIAGNPRTEKPMPAGMGKMDHGAHGRAGDADKH